jgi:hypothetical protein
MPLLRHIPRLTTHLKRHPPHDAVEAKFSWGGPWMCVSCRGSISRFGFEVLDDPIVILALHVGWIHHDGEDGHSIPRERFRAREGEHRSKDLITSGNIKVSLDMGSTSTSPE